MAADMFLKLKGVNGESKDDKHKGEIDVYSFSFGVSQSGSMGAGGGGGVGKAHFADISITKKCDLATSALLTACATGKHIDTGVITARKAGEKPLEYLIVELEQIVVTNVSFGGGAGGEVTESVTLNYGKIKITYNEQDAKGAGAAKAPFTYDVKANKSA